MQRRLTGFLLVLFLFFAASFPTKAAASSVVYFYGTDRETLINVNMLYNLLGHFDGDLQAVNVLDYTSGGMAAHDFVVFYALNWDAIPAPFLADVATGTHRVLWVGGGLDQLGDYLDGPGPFGFVGGTIVENSDQFDQVNYRGRAIPRYTKQNFFATTVTGEAHVYAELSSTHLPKTYPYFTCGGNLCFVADDPFIDNTDDDRYLVFADLLHEYFLTGVTARKRAMVRLEDLAPVVTNSELLIEYAEALHARGIPFSFGVIPYFVDPEGRYFEPGTEFRLEDDPHLLAAIEYLREIGGTMIMHGVTHQHTGISREDWEFSLGLDNCPVPEDSAAWVRERVERGLDGFAAVGYRPAIWETPHYSASWGDYLTFGEYFDVCYERLLAFPVRPGEDPSFGEQLDPYSQMIPYFLQTSSSGMAVLPESLNLIDLSSPDPFWHPDGKLEYADRLSVIRDGVASVFVHFEFVPFEDFAVLLDGLTQRGYTFVGPEEFLGAIDDVADDDTADDDDDDDDNNKGCGC